MTCSPPRPEDCAVASREKARSFDGPPFLVRRDSRVDCGGGLAMIHTPSRLAVADEGRGVVVWHIGRARSLNRCGGVIAGNVRNQAAGRRCVIPAQTIQVFP